MSISKLAVHEFNGLPSRTSAATTWSWTLAYVKFKPMELSHLRICGNRLAMFKCCRQPPPEKGSGAVCVCCVCAVGLGPMGAPHAREFVISSATLHGAKLMMLTNIKPCPQHSPPALAIQRGRNHWNTRGKNGDALLMPRAQWRLLPPSNIVLFGFLVFFFGFFERSQSRWRRSTSNQINSDASSLQLFSSFLPLFILNYNPN